MVSTYIAYIGSKLNYFCSDLKAELQKKKIKMQVSKVIYLNKGNAILEYQQTKQNNFKFLAEMLSLILTEFRKGMKILLKL